MGVAEEPVAAVGKLGIAGNRKGEDREGDERNPYKPDLSRADLFKANLFQTILSRANLSHDFLPPTLGVDRAYRMQGKREQDAKPGPLCQRRANRLGRRDPTPEDIFCSKNVTIARRDASMLGY